MGLFPVIAKKQTWQMPARKYAAEIARNRLLTNWAAVYLSTVTEDGTAPFDETRLISPKYRFKTFTRMKLLTLALGGAGLVLLFAFQITAPPPSSTLRQLTISSLSSASPTAELSATNRCSEKGLHAALDGQAVPVPEIPQNYSLLGRQLFGGAVFMQLDCTDSAIHSSYEVEWLLSRGKWQLKQISRLPERQSGDLVNAN